MSKESKGTLLGYTVVSTKVRTPFKMLCHFEKHKGTFSEEKNNLAVVYF